jgi:hypothetical protein
MTSADLQPRGEEYLRGSECVPSSISVVACRHTGFLNKGVYFNKKSDCGSKPDVLWEEKDILKIKAQLLI